MLRPYVLTALPLVAGCQAIGESIGIDIQGVEDAVEGLTDPMVAQGIVLGVEEPQASALQPLVDKGLINPGVSVTVFLANAAEAADLATAPVDGADVVVQTPEDASTADPTGGIAGSYAYKTATGDGLEYIEDDTWTLWADAGREKASWIEVVLPKAAELNLPRSIGRDENLRLDFTDQGYNSAIVTVFYIGGGPTWTNFPISINDVYQRSLGHEPLEELVVPEIAFPKTGLYGISVAGMVHNDDEQLGELNKLLSRGMSGLLHVETLEVK